MSFMASRMVLNYLPGWDDLTLAHLYPPLYSSMWNPLVQLLWATSMLPWHMSCLRAFVHCPPPWGGPFSISSSDPHHFFVKYQLQPLCSESNCLNQRRSLFSICVPQDAWQEGFFSDMSLEHCLSLEFIINLISIKILKVLWKITIEILL